jgi:hypothetical protein
MTSHPNGLLFLIEFHSFARGRATTGPKKGRHMASPFFQNFLDLFVAGSTEGRQELQQVRCTDLAVSVQVSWARTA